MQQELMKLYKDEKINPLAGCLPIVIQIPIFYALYKVLMLTIEMRHQPFVLWIKDLSAPDPLHILNLFGLLDFNPPAFLGIGVLALLLGLTMFLQFRLNPQATDPVQQQVFRSEEHTSELQSLMRISYAVFCLKKKKKHNLHSTR